MNTNDAPLIAGDELKTAARKFVRYLQSKVENEQKGFFGIFDKWFTQVMTRLSALDPARSWEEGVGAEIARNPAQGQSLNWDFLRFRLFLDHWRQGRFVEFAGRERASRHYTPRFGTEFGSDVFLTSQGAPQMMRWRGIPLMKTVFDFALYPMMLSELRPRTIFEIGSGLGASALWLADHLALLGLQSQVHSVDISPPALSNANVSFYKGDCSMPESLFDPALLAAAPHPWLVIEDAHHNVEAVLHYFHKFLIKGDYLMVEDSEIKREDLRRFLAAHPGCYLIDTQFTDFFGRNATCAGDSIFVRN